MKYQHDCEACVYLGEYGYHAPMVEGTEWKEVELYHCKQAGSCMGGSIIARYGSKGSNYASCPVSLIRRDYLTRAAGEMSTYCPAIIEGYRRSTLL